MWSSCLKPFYKSVCTDALWQCAVLIVTCWLLSCSMSQSHPSISWAGLSPHASYQPDFDGHMLPLCLAGRSFEETQQKWQQWLGRHTPVPPDPTSQKTQICTSMLKHTCTELYFATWCSSWWTLKRCVHFKLPSPLKLVTKLNHLRIMSCKLS